MGSSALLCLLLLYLAAGGASARAESDFLLRFDAGTEPVTLTGPQQRRGAGDGSPCSLTTYCASGDELREQQRCPSALRLPRTTASPPQPPRDPALIVFLAVLGFLLVAGILVVWRVLCRCRRKNRLRRRNLRHANLIRAHLGHLRLDQFHRPRPPWVPGMPAIYLDYPPPYSAVDPRGNRALPALSPTVQFRRSNEDGEAEAIICPAEPRNTADLDSESPAQAEPSAARP